MTEKKIPRHPRLRERFFKCWFFCSFFFTVKSMLKKHHITCKFIKTCKTLDELYPPHLKFSSIKRRFREFFLISERNGRKSFMAKGTTGYIAEKEIQLKQPRKMVHPYSKFRECWEIFIISVFCLSLFIRPIITCDCNTNNWSTISYQMSALFADLIEVVDIILLFFVGFIDKETGNVVFDLKKIFYHRITDFNFLLNIVASLPLEFLVFIFKGKVNEKLPEPWKSVFFLKIFKLFMITKYLSHVAKIYNFSELTAAVIWGIIMNFSLCHWITCLYHQLFIFDTVYGDGKLAALDTNDYIQKDEVLLHYTKFFYAISATLLDRNVMLRKSKHTLYNTIFWSLTTALFYFTGIVTFGLIIHYSALMKNSGIYYEEMKQEIQKFLAQENLPREIHKKVKQYLEFRFRNNYFDEKLIFQTLSPPLRREVASYLCSNLLMDRKSIFKDIPADLLTEVCLQMKYEVFLAGDVFFRSETHVQKMYFLYKGSVAVYSKEGREVMHWYEGQFFGVSAFVPMFHPVTVLALEICECYRLRYKDFLKAIAEAPEYAKIVAKAAIDRRQYIIGLYSDDPHMDTKKSRN